MPRKTRQVKVIKQHKPLALYEHQQKVVNAYKLQQLMRFFLVWHRRAGKDVFGLDFARERALECIGSYWHLFPFHVQARRAIWEGIDKRTGARFIDRAFPESIRDGLPNNTEMSIRLKNGSMWQMLGSDNYDRLVGANPAGVLFSEYALCDPAAWDYIRPILVENKGWAFFVTTFRGRNHAYRMFETVKGNPSWYVDLRTIDDTCRNDGSPIVTAADVQEEIASGMSESLARQEFYCDPDAANTGAIFTKQYNRIMQTTAESWNASNKVLRVAWGMHEEGIAAIVYEGDLIISANTFLEQNIVDAVQAITRRHPRNVLTHCGVNLDRALFSELDGDGVFSMPAFSNSHMNDGRVAALLNTSRFTNSAREYIADFCMSYTPHRDVNDDSQLVYPAFAEALAVMQRSKTPARKAAVKPLDYSLYDRGII